MGKTGSFWKKKIRCLIYVFPNFSGVDKRRDPIFPCQAPGTCKHKYQVPLLYNWLNKFEDNCMHASCLLGLKTHYCNKVHKVNDNSLISWYVYTP